jgi:ferredoxin
MSLVRYVAVNIIGTILRFFPWRGKAGLIEIGHPGRSSPVLVTCNYRLTMERVRGALQGMDAYLLVANSRGINVWCAATGGLLTNHDIISVLKTSGIEDSVDHREVILPQLAATGIEARVVEKMTGWKVVWGPVYAQDIALFTKSKMDKTEQMREVAFPWTQRIEMATAWAFPISLFLALIMMLLWREGILPGLLLVWGLSLLIYLSFPLYGRWLGSGRGFSFIVFAFVILWVLVMLGLVSYCILAGGSDWGPVARWGFVSFIVLLFLGIDFLGSTPMYKSSLHEDRLLKVALDEQKCRGVGYCEQVCPRNCYEVDRDQRRARMRRAERCVQCGACVVQCPFDALYFRSPDGEMIPPETIRKFKLNLMGRRLVK